MSLNLFSMLSLATLAPPYPIFLTNLSTVPEPLPWYLALLIFMMAFFSIAASFSELELEPESEPESDPDPDSDPELDPELDPEPESSDLSSFDSSFLTGCCWMNFFSSSSFLRSSFAKSLPSVSLLVNLEMKN